VSTFVDVEVRCPACDATGRRYIASSINASRTPEWRREILDGGFQRSRCEACGHVTFHLMPFPYMDFGRRQYVGVFPSGHEAAWWTYETEAEAAHEANLGAEAPGPARTVGSGMAVRTVFGLAALREKLIVFDADLDDAVVEALKLRLMFTDARLAPELGRRPRLVAVDHRALHFRVAGEERSSSFSCTVDRAAYEELAGDRAVDEIVSTLRSGSYRDSGRLLRPDPRVSAA